MITVQVGDPLALRFEIQDPRSPYQIFVRELVAMDGKDTSEILLIDSFGKLWIGTFINFRFLCQLKSLKRIRIGIEVLI